MSGWLTALRIACREVRRARGRAALVVALIGLPVVGLSFAAASHDMFRLTPQERAPRELGAADVELRWEHSGPIEQRDARGDLVRPLDDGQAVIDPGTGRTAADIETVLPPGSRVTPRYVGESWMTSGDRVARLAWQAFDLADPLTAGLATVTSGDAPHDDGEVALTAGAADRLGVDVGGRIDVDGRAYTVVGIVRFPGVPDNYSIPGLTDDVALFHPDHLPAPPWSTRWLADTPEPVTWARVRELNRLGIVAFSRAVLLDPPPELTQPSSTSDARAFRAGTVVAGLAALEVVLLAGPAFAVGARRRQRELALVAVAGGTPAHLRRIVLADGVVLGLSAAAAGTLLGVVAAVAARPVAAERLYGALPGGVRVFPLALPATAGFAVVTGVLAALVPAFTAARQDVVAALAGRRGARGFRRRWLVTGLVLVGVGGAVAAFGAWHVVTLAVLAGLVLAQLGAALCVPALIGLVARLGGRLPLTARLALRDTARNRSSAAPAISAVMAAVAGAVAVGVAIVSFQASVSVEYAHLPGTATAGFGSSSAPGSAPVTPEAVEQAARETLPVAEVFTVHGPVCPDDDTASCSVFAVVPPEKRCPYVVYELPGPQGFGGATPMRLSPEDQRRAARDPRCDGPLTVVGFNTVVDDGAALAARTGVDGKLLEQAAAALRNGGAVVTDERFLDDRGRVTLVVTTFDSDRPTTDPFTVPGHLLAEGHPRDGAIVSPAALRSAGFEVVPSALLFTTTRMPTEGEADAFRAAMERLGTWGYVELESRGWSDVLAGLAVLGLAAGLVALGAAGIATGLAAVDRRPDLAILGAVGAAPRIRRLMSLHQSGVIAGLGTLLGLAAGLSACVAVLTAMNQRHADQWPAPEPIPIIVPWPYLAGLLAVPVVAMLGAGMLTRSRLPIERRPT
ncbi:MAG TPA: FtsX-like permease family protein [Natronosporangium sp.]